MWWFLALGADLAEALSGATRAGEAAGLVGATPGRRFGGFDVVRGAVMTLMAIGAALLRSGEVSPRLFARYSVAAPPAPEGYMWSPPLLCAVWMAAIVLLWFPCHWYAGIKARRREPWSSYF